MCINYYCLLFIVLFSSDRHAAAWAHSLWNDMEEDDDSDTDSRLSGSVAVDSVMLVRGRESEQGRERESERESERERTRE